MAVMMGVVWRRGVGCGDGVAMEVMDVLDGGCGRDEGNGGVKWWLSWSSSRGGGGCGKDGVVAGIRPESGWKRKGGVEMFKEGEKMYMCGG
ncbi:hypothetical protein Tco_1064733 [Tanacetum coccineum]